MNSFFCLPSPSGSSLNAATLTIVLFTMMALLTTTTTTTLVFAQTRCDLIPASSLCVQFTNQSRCGLDNPFYCRYPSSDKSYLCLNEWDIRTNKYECQGGCFDLRACGVQSCSDTCTRAQCMTALNVGKECPDPDEDFSYRFVCTGGPLVNQCGRNWGTQEGCRNGSTCFRQNPRCFDCCDFSTCVQYESCLNVNCSEQSCQNNRCIPAEPFYCQAGSLAHGQCSAIPAYFPLTGCPDCCDLTSCDANPCGWCPEELCRPAVCWNPMFPVLCQNSTNYPENNGKCMPFGYWPSTQSCDTCCTCKPSN